MSRREWVMCRPPMLPCEYALGAAAAFGLMGMATAIAKRNEPQGLTAFCPDCHHVWFGCMTCDARPVNNATLKSRLLARLASLTPGTDEHRAVRDLCVRMGYDV